VRMLPIARPCRARFHEMPGDDKVRFCGDCGKHVYDLSAHTEAEARALFAERRGERTCVRFAKDAKGSVLFRAAALGAAVGFAACSTHSTEPAPASPACVASATDHDLGDTIPDEPDRCPDLPAGENDYDHDGCPPPSDSPSTPDPPDGGAPDGAAVTPDAPL